MSRVIYLTNEDFDESGNLKNYKDYDSIIMFFENWCGHCVHTKPEFIKFSETMGDNQKAFLIEGSSNRDLLSRISLEKWGYEVKGFPTIVGYAKGKFFSEYGYNKEDRESFRKDFDFQKYADELGKEDTVIYWV